ncbi:lipopolysaccharide assembly LapA domain-containing protein [Brevibacterium sandarakinum]|uniref:LapA family protein n=1 Tax=Brevibacterium sandarakinum TaxID=629680 RepID=UPI00265203DE|nr:lipopolysaccharide assembly protein LapA domain-containing protein [Brevibacterium sandarakinum]MDN5658077.1 lipopolysaccharide assembly protein LapA domain-containing protein [Brevibacterium sandarakinum]
MSTQDPRGESQSPDELLAETQSLLGDEDSTTGDTREVEPTQQTDPTQQEPTPAGKNADLSQLKGGSGMSAGMWISLILGAVIVVLLLIFILQNNVPADFQYFGWQFQLPLGVAMLFAAIGGIFIAGIIGSVRIFVLSRRLKKIKKALGR